MFQIWYNNNLIKTYPYKIQAITWLFLNGFVEIGRGKYFTDDNFKIKEVK